MTRQTIRFEPNQPLTLALEYPEGVNVPGFRGPQVRYFLTENRVVYLEPEAAEAVRLLQPQVNEPFTLTKRRESGRRPWWEAEKLKRNPLNASDTPERHNQTPAPVEIESSPVSAPNFRPVPSVPAAKIPPQPATAPPSLSGARNRPIPQKPSYEEALRYCVLTVQKVLEETGEQWSDSSRQAMVSTMMIQAGREGGIAFRIQQERTERVA